MIITQNEQAKIRARCQDAVKLIDELIANKTITETAHSILMLSMIDNSTLLNALEEAENLLNNSGELAKSRKDWIERAEKAESDRDYYRELFLASDYMTVWKRGEEFRIERDALKARLEALAKRLREEGVKK